MKKIIYTNRQKFDIIIDKIKQEWVDKLHILADFDGTMTKVFFNWKKRHSLVSLLRWEKWALWKKCAIEDEKLFNTYHPIEIDPNINIEEKKEKMIEWWTNSFNLFIKYWLSKNIIKDISSSKEIELREGIKSFLEFTNLNNIPFIIISASWIWKKSISYFLKERWLLFPNIYIISNDFNWDENWKAVSFKYPIIHSFNKWETILKDFPEIHDKIENRKNVLLLWDSLWDHHMIDWFKYNNLLNIWFLNDKEDELLESYKERYDVVLTWDNDWNILNELLK